MPADEALKRLRITRKKIRQIDELLQQKHDGAELNAEQEAKILLRPGLAKELALRTKQVEEQRKAEAAGQPAPGGGGGGGEAENGQEEEAEKEAEEDPAPGPAEDSAWAADADQWGGGSAAAWHVAGAANGAPKKKKTSKTPAPMPSQADEDEWNSDVPLAASVAARAEEQLGSKQAGQAESPAVATSPEESAPSPSPPPPPPVPAPAKEDKKQEAPLPAKPAKQQAKTAKLDKEAPYRKGWRGGCFSSRRIPSAHRTAVSCVFVARGAGGPGRIVTGGYDNIAKVWNLETLKEEQSLGGHTKAVTACFADSIYLATASDDGTVKYWTNGHCDTSLYTFSPVKCMSIEGDDLITGHADGTVRVYEAGVGGTEPPRLVLKGHTGEVTSVRTANGGASILSTAKDSSCRVWDSNRGTLLHVLQEESDVVDGTHCYGAAWITDAKVILTTHDDGTCRAWEYPFSSSSRSLLPDQDMVDCEPLMHVDSLGNSMALSRSDGSFAGCNPRTLGYEYTLSPGGGSVATMHCSGDVAVMGTYDGLVMVLDGVDERKVPKGTELVACGPPVIGGMQAPSPSKSPGGGAKNGKKKQRGGSKAAHVAGVAVDEGGQDASKAMMIQAGVAAVVAVLIFLVWQTMSA